MKEIKKIIILFFLAVGVAIGQQEFEIGEAYFKQGEFDKAAAVYKKLAGNKQQANAIHEHYFVSLLKLKDFATAEKFLKSQIKSNENLIGYKAELAFLYEASGKTDLSRREYETVIEEAAKTEVMVYDLQNYFFKINKIDLVINLLLNARDKSKDPFRFDTQLARAYLFVGQKDKMLQEIIGYGARSKNISYVQATIQDNIKEEEEIEMLEKTLYGFIQNQPNETFYNEVLIWHFVQKADYGRAFIQARSLDKRLALEGSKVFEIGGLCYSAKDYRNAVKMYQYIMDEYPNGELYPYARRWLIQSKEELVKNTFPINQTDIRELIAQYNLMLSDLGIKEKTLDALRNVALLQAFYLAEYDKAIETLETAISVAVNNQKFKDQCKLDLGDIYILKNEPWESTLLYMQVEKSQKEETLGEQAKLKNARLQYYTGQFELAKEILDILKKATTREIANDAMQLSLLIQDNTGLDTSEVAMAEFARVDLLIFQNKYQESITALGTLYEKYKTHSLADEILFLRANTLLKINRINEASKDLEDIVENYKYDILADDALFLLAKINEENRKDAPKAMELYRKILKEYPNSIFGAQARVRFRELRGDIVN